MDVKISAVHFDATQQLEEFIVKRVEKLSRFYDGIIKAEVTLKVIKPETANNKEVLIRLVVPGNDLIANKTADTFEEASDLAAAALEKQIEKMKTKL